VCMGDGSGGSVSVRTCVCAHAGCEQAAGSVCVQRGVVRAPTLLRVLGGCAAVRGAHEDSGIGV